MIALVVQSKRMGGQIHREFASSSQNTHLRIPIPYDGVIRRRQTIYNHGIVNAPKLRAQGRRKSKPSLSNGSHKDTNVLRMQSQSPFDHTDTVNCKHHQRNAGYLHLHCALVSDNNACCLLQRIAGHCTLGPGRGNIQNRLCELAQDNDSRTTPEYDSMVSQSLKFRYVINVGFDQPGQHPLACCNRLPCPSIKLGLFAEPVFPQRRAGRWPTERCPLHALLCSVIGNGNPWQEHRCYKTGLVGSFVWRPEQPTLLIVVVHKICQHTNLGKRLIQCQPAVNKLLRCQLVRWRVANLGKSLTNVGPERVVKDSIDHRAHNMIGGGSPAGVRWGIYIR
mmetsp:Transcript_11084/g.23881  ORF Transcript_11084/g.23881 Transcript_11084/m.23881 type:complete len:336 (-) Transcript_11084:619-1626(-)